MMKIGEKLEKAHEYIVNSYYISDENLNLNGRKWNDVVLFSLITGLNNGRQLILGTPGTGKTTVAEIVTSILGGYEPGFVQSCTLDGHRDLTQEKIFGRPDLGELNKGNEKVIWSFFAKFPGSKIVDEINRIPEGGQNILLNSIDRGIFKYLNETLYCRVPFYATANYPDRGTYPLIQPLSDRFDICVECTPSVGSTFFYESAEKNKQFLIDERIRRNMIRSLEENDFEKLNELTEEYRTKLKENGIPTFNAEEISKFKEVHKNIKFNGESELFLAVFFDDVNAITKTLEDNSKRMHDCYKNFPVGIIENNLSYRWLNGVKKYCKVIASILGKKNVDIEILRKVMPYSLAHRITVSDEYIQNNLKYEFYPGSQIRYVSEKIVEDFFRDFYEKIDVYRDFYGALFNRDSRTMEELANKYDLPAIRSIYYGKLI